MEEKFYSIRGKISRYMPTDFVEKVTDYCNANGFEGYIHLGCPLGANADDEKAFTADALLITKQCGVIVFDFPQDAADKQKILNEQDAVYAQTENYFRNYSKTLIRARKLIFDFEVVSVVPSEIEDIPEGYNICSSYEMADIFAAYSHPLDDETYQKVRATLQRVAGLRPAVENDNVSEDDIVSLGGKMAHINRAIKNMDQDQHGAANEFTKAPLRIRGIAGSGKTIVLAGRAAYMHMLYPNWNIAVTFYSRALKQQLEDLIRIFYRSYNPFRDPNREKIHVLHSWGEWSGKDGFYSQAVSLLGAKFRNFSEAAEMAGGDESKAFDAACEELLSEKFAGKFTPVYDAVLIDEAQDMPASFFKLVYNFTKTNDEGEKCIIWAYDELQSLQDINIPDESELFGTDANGLPLISLVEEDNKPRQNIPLSTCYRNPMWILVVAHALGFGIYRRPAEEKSVGLVQMFDDLSAWENVGYECVEGTLDFGQKVVLRRKASATPD